MLRRLHATVAGVLVWFAMFGVQAVCAAEAEIAFEPPKIVLVRQSNGAPARGQLLRITESDLWLRVLNGTELKLKLERVRSVKSPDQSLEFWPGSESFYDFATRMQKSPGVAVTGTIRKGGSTGRNGARGQGAANAVSAANGTDDADEQRHRRRKEREADQQQSQNPTANSASKNPFNGQLADSSQTQHGRTPPPREADDLNPPAETADATSGDPQPGSEVLSCSKCGEELPANFKSGSKCPHCGTVAVFDDGGSSNPFAVAGSSGGAGGNPFQANGGAQPAAAPPPQVVPQVQSQGFDMANMPWFAKAGIFAAFIVVGWFMIQRRG